MKKIGVLLPTRSQFPVNDRYTVDKISYMSCEQKALSKIKNNIVVRKKDSFNFLRWSENIVGSRGRSHDAF